MQVQPAYPDTHYIHQIADEPLHSLLLPVGLCKRFQEGRNIRGVNSLPLEQALQAPFEQTQSEMQGCQRVSEFMPCDAEESLHLRIRLAQGLFPLSMQAGDFHCRQALAHQRQKEQCHGAQGRSQGMKYARA